MTTREPWLQEKKWATNSIRSNAKTSIYVLSVFCLIWWGVNLVLFLNHEKLLREFEKEPLIAFVLLFPLAGVWLLILTFNSIQQWRRIGPTPLTLDPFPGSIGGHVGGTIDTNIPYNPKYPTKVELLCIYSYMSGSGKNRSRSDKIEWQSDGVCHSEMSSKGTRFQFRFDIPDQLPETDVNHGSSYHLWRLQLSNGQKGIKLDRQYELPVFKTAQQSRNIRSGTEDYNATVESAVGSIQSIAKITATGSGLEAWFPAFQRPGSGFAGMLFGCVFTAAGLFAGSMGAPLLFPILFSFVGGIIFLVSLHYLGKALLVNIDNHGISSRRFLFGIPITTKKISANEFLGFEERETGTTQTRKKSRVSYQIYAKTSAGKDLIVAERLEGKAEARVLQERFEQFIDSKI